MSHPKSGKADSQRYSQFLSPAYWPVWLGMGMLWLLTRLPYGIQMALGRQFGRLAYRLLSNRRKVCETNIRLCFPELNAGEQQKLVYDTFVSYGQGLMESAFSWFGNTDKLAPITRVSGVEYLNQARAEGRGVLMVGAHFALLDMAGRLFAPHADFHVVQREHDNPLFNLFMTRARLIAARSAIARKNMRGMIRVLKKKEILWYAPDQDYGKNNSVFVPFFGVQTATITATSRMAEMTGVEVIPISCFRDNDGYFLEIGPPLDIPSQDDQQDAVTYNRWLETQIRRAPEQYLWLHKRFKSRPDGENGLY